MHDMNAISKLIKRAAVEAVGETKPTAIVFGKVVSANPLEINIEQKLTLTDTQLILTNNVRDYELQMTVDHDTDVVNLDTNHAHQGVASSSFDATHKHGYSGKKVYTVHNALIVGDEVLMIQVQGGQKYIVLEKVVKA